ncbi:MAG: polymer-forming cytoskeletal protein [Kiritimatiellae bacterium]|nr:polymer-forming cytoskeletal protein [Kiritimatiellia bacterium]
MALNKKANMMDGFDVVRSLDRAREAAARTSSAPPPPAPSSGPLPPAPGAPNPHIVKTIRPSQHTVRCFECGYEFKISGTTRTLYCAKCRAKIDMGDYTIDRPFTGEICTGGTVRVLPSGCLVNARVRAGNIILEGGIDSSTTLECTQWLELAGGATPSPRQFTARNLRIAANHSVRLAHKLLVHHLELRGELEGDIEATGLVDIRDGGHLKGILRGAHLQVEEGGGLSARVFIWPQDPAP